MLEAAQPVGEAVEGEWQDLTRGASRPSRQASCKTRPSKMGHSTVIHL